VVVALILAAVALAAAVAFATRGTEARTHDALPTGACTDALFFQGTRYVARPVRIGAIARAEVLGRGVLRSCGGPTKAPAVTSLARVDARRALGVTDSRAVIYVAPACARATPARLLSCLRTPR
jgi:hypothetical protein